MTTYRELNNKLTDKRKHMAIPRGYADVTPDELRPLVQVVNSNTGCGLFAALAIVAVVVKLVLS